MRIEKDLQGQGSSAVRSSSVIQFLLMYEANMRYITMLRHHFRLGRGATWHQVEPGFIQEDIYRHMASSDNEKLHNLKHSLSR